MTVVERDLGWTWTDPTQPKERTPWLLAFLCLIIPIIPINEVFPGPLKSHGSPAKIIGLTMLGLVVLGFAFLPRMSPPRTFYPGVLFLFVYWASDLLCWAVGLTHLGSDIVEAGKNRAVLDMICFFGACLYSMTRIRTERQRSIVLGALAIGLVYECIIGIIQHTSQIDLHLLLTPPGLSENFGDQGKGTGQTLDHERFGALRSFGTAMISIEFAVLAAIAVPIMIHFTRYAKTRQVRGFAALGCVICLLAVPTGVSRSGVIALLVSMSVYMWTFTLRQLASAVLVAVGAIASASLASPTTLPALYETITGSPDDESIISRLNATLKVAQILHEHPIFGLGPGSTPPIEFGFIDNEWLGTLANGGLVGFFGLFIFAVGGIFAFTAALRRVSTPSERGLTFAMGGVFMGILATSYTFDLFGFGQVTFVFFIMNGLLWSYSPVKITAPRDAAVNRTVRTNSRAAYQTA